MIRSAGRAGAVSAAVLAALAAAGCTGFKVRLVEKSMEPTIRSGELADLDEYAYDYRDPERGDIISFAPPPGGDEFACEAEPAAGAPCGLPAGEGEGTSLVKRVIALPGELVAIDAGGRAVIDGQAQPEDYVIPCEPEDECELPKAIRVPDGHYFVMGDNRPYSVDSRVFGPIPYAAIEGEVDPPGD